MSRTGEVYIEITSRIEQLHRNFLDLVKLELDAQGIYDITNVQALIVFNIGDAEMTVGDLALRGCYIGSNVSYNVKKLVENGYLSQERSVHDRRSRHVRLTKKGVKLGDWLENMHRHHAELLGHAAITNDDLLSTVATLRRLDRFWTSVRQRNA